MFFKYIERDCFFFFAKLCAWDDTQNVMQTKWVKSMAFNRNVRCALVVNSEHGSLKWNFALMMTYPSFLHSIFIPIVEWWLLASTWTKWTHQFNVYGTWSTYKKRMTECIEWMIFWDGIITKQGFLLAYIGNVMYACMHVIKLIRFALHCFVCVWAAAIECSLYCVIKPGWLELMPFDWVLHHSFPPHKQTKPNQNAIFKENARLANRWLPPWFRIHREFT